MADKDEAKAPPKTPEEIAEEERKAQLAELRKNNPPAYPDKPAKA